MTMSILTRAGFLCEFAQAVDSVSLGERSTTGNTSTSSVGGGGGGSRGNRITVGDIMLRMNHLLSHPTVTKRDERDGDDIEYYPLRGDGSKIQGYMLSSMIDALTASGLFSRLVEPILALVSDDQQDEKYLALCRCVITGLSGGEQQRLRLASLFFLEKVRYDVFCGRLSPEVSNWSVLSVCVYVNTDSLSLTLSLCLDNWLSWNLSHAVTSPR